ncbi:hypothetical protein D9M71_561390 [compost metagenome]
MHQAHVLADEIAEPLGSGVPGIRDAKAVAPDGDAAQVVIRLRHSDVQCGVTRRRQGEAAIGVVQGRQLAHLRVHALGQEAPIVTLHQQPAAVPAQPQKVQRGSLQRLTAR